MSQDVNLWYLGGISASVALFCLLRAVSNRMLSKLCRHIISSEYEAAFFGIMQKSRETFLRHQSGELIDVFSKYVGSFERLITSVFSTGLPAMVLYIALLAIAFFLGKTAGFVLAAFQVVNLAVCLALLPALKKRSFDLLKSHYQLSDTWIETLTLNREVQQLHSFEFNFKPLHQQIKTMTECLHRKDILIGDQNILTSGLPLLSSLVLAPFIVAFVDSGVLSWGSAFALLTINGLLFSQVAYIIDGLQALTEFKAIREDFDKIRSEPCYSVGEGTVSAYDIQIAPHHIKYGEAVGLNIPDPLFIPQGQKLAVIGKSGAGKSTFLRHFEHSDLENRKMLKVDGVPAMAIATPEFQRLIRICFQDVALLSGQNLWPQREVDNGEMHRILAALELPQDIALGERTLEPYNENVSGGEAKRLAVARSLLSLGEINVFDEPTTGLNPRLSRTVWQTIFKEAGEKTLICTTHDMSEVSLFDRVLILEKGKIVADVTPDELIDNTHFAELNGEEVTSVAQKRA